MQITFTVPAETITRFVVAAERPPERLSSVIPWRMCRAHRRRAAEAFGTSRLEITPYRGARSPEPPAHEAKHRYEVTSAASPADLPEAAQVARAAARALAEACDGVIIDPLTGHRHDGEAAGEPEAFRLADQWLGWCVDVDDRASCPPWDPASSGTCACLTVSTRGLSRFGLPEIMVEGAACVHSHCTVQLLRTVAHHLVRGQLGWAAWHPRGGHRSIADHVTIGVRTPMHARLVPRGDPLRLQVVPPPDFDGGVNEWLCRAA